MGPITDFGVPVAPEAAMGVPRGLRPSAPAPGPGIHLDPHVAAGQRACLDTSGLPFLECTLPLALLLALLLLHFSFCTSPFALLLLHSSDLRNSFSLFSDRFSAGCFLSCYFPKEILLILGCFSDTGPMDPRRETGSFFASIFGPRFFSICIDF